MTRPADDTAPRFSLPLPPTPGPKKNRLAEMIRVDHAGEYGAVTIYRGQHAVFSKLKGKERMAALLKEMEEGEQHHLATFDQLLIERNIRPTAFAPIWNVAGFALGAGTALLGEKAAMACTTAVESVIEKHYAEQIDELEGNEDEAELRDTVIQFREDELEHHDTAIDEGAEQAIGYPVLRALIGAGCKMAIKLSEKV